MLAYTHQPNPTRDNGPCICPMINGLSSLSVPARSNNFPDSPLNQSHVNPFSEGVRGIPSQKGLVFARFHSRDRTLTKRVFSPRFLSSTAAIDDALAEQPF